MKPNKDILETIAYYCFGIATLGTLFVLRLIITVAIRKAFEEE